ncbi:MAG: zonular occludens toxin domain-containing protein [Clostridia bacterium]
MYKIVSGKLCRRRFKIEKKQRRKIDHCFAFTSAFSQSIYTLLYHSVGFVISIPCIILTIDRLSKAYSFAELTDFWVYAILSVIFTLPSLRVICCIMLCSHRDKKQGEDASSVCVVKIGSPGTGKTASTVWDSVVEAKRRWKIVKFQYWLYTSMLVDFKTTNDWDGLRTYREVKQCYDYYHRHTDLIPLLWCNIPMRVGDKNCSVVTRAHAEQREKLPYMAVIVFDEIGSLFFADESKKNRPLAVSDFFRLCRHFNCFKIFCTEQDSANIYIDVRRVVSYNVFCKSQSWILKPTVLLLFIMVKQWSLSFSWDIKLTQINVARRWYKYISFCNKIGFRKIKYADERNTERTSAVKANKGTIYLPSSLNAKYDSRCFSELYEASHRELQYNPFSALYIEPDSLLATEFLRAKKCLLLLKK